MVLQPEMCPSKIPPLQGASQPVQLAGVAFGASSARATHDTVLLGADDAYSGAAACALVVVSVADAQLA